MLNDLLATLAFGLLVGAWTLRRRRSLHVPLALAGLALDLALVVYLEVSRSVVEKTMTEDFSALRWVHIWTSTLAVLLYLPTLWYGFRLLRGDESVRPRHKRFAVAALLLRTVGFACMWGVEAASP